MGQHLRSIDWGGGQLSENILSWLVIPFRMAYLSCHLRFRYILEELCILQQPSYMSGVVSRIGSGHYRRHELVTLLDQFLSVDLITTCTSYNYLPSYTGLLLLFPDSEKEEGFV